MALHARHHLERSSLPRYARRRPEFTPCYRIVQEHLSTFVAEREVEGRPLPKYVLEEFEAYLKCGIPAYGGNSPKKLAALILPPKSHLVRWAGVFAPNSPYRKEITLRPAAKKGFDFTETEGGAGIRRKNYTWSKMLARVFKIEVLRCDACGGQLRPVCAVTEPDSIRRYLRHMNIDYDPPPRGPPRITQGVFDFDGEDQSLPK